MALAPDGDLEALDTPSARRDLGCGTAGYRILHPEGADSNDPNPGPANDPTENRWHRALAFLEVPSRMERHSDSVVFGLPPDMIDAGKIDVTSPLDGEPLGIYRTPGKINLNTLRYPEVLAGLSEGEQVVVNPPPALRDGQRVTVGGR